MAQKKTDDAKPEPQKPGDEAKIQDTSKQGGPTPFAGGKGDSVVEPSDDQTIGENHWPAQSPETSNQHGEETEADTVAEAKNADGRTNQMDFVKNTGVGPGNPEFRYMDPAHLMSGKPIAENPRIIADKPLDDKGNELATEETPKMVNQTVTAAGAREYTNNVLPDMSQRRPLVQEAETININVDPDWDDDRLRAEIEMARQGRADLQVKGAVPPAEFGRVDYDQATAQQKRATVALQADYWEDDGEGGTRRVYADSEQGRSYQTSREEAQKLIDQGKAQRTDPLP